MEGNCKSCPDDVRLWFLEPMDVALSERRGAINLKAVTKAIHSIAEIILGSWVGQKCHHMYPPKRKEKGVWTLVGKSKGI